VPGTVGDGECPAKVSRHLSSVSTHQVQGGAKDGERRVMAIGIKLLGLKKIKLANLLPGLIFAVLYALLFHALKLV